MDIVTVAGLQEEVGKPAFIATDQETIYVDRNLYEIPNRQPRYRFTLAHEIGHHVLHAAILRNISVADVADWKRFVGQLAEEAWDRFEWQANWFAGHVLVPPSELRRVAEKTLPQIQRSIDRARDSGLSRGDYLEYAIERWIRKITPRFYVSSDVVRIRLEADGLLDLIP